MEATAGSLTYVDESVNLAGAETAADIVAASLAEKVTHVGAEGLASLVVVACALPGRGGAEESGKHNGELHDELLTMVNMAAASMGQRRRVHSWRDVNEGNGLGV